MNLRSQFKNAKRVAVLGVGSELRGDDAAGLLVAGHIQKNFKSNHPKLKVFFGSTAPENLTGEIKKFKPTHLVIIDSADTGAKAGSIFLFKPKDLRGISFCTHQLPLQILTDYLKKSLGCKLIIVGVQPKKLTFNKPISASVEKAAKEAAQLILVSLA